MQILNLDPIPNQSLSARLDNQRYDIVLKETRGVMSVDIARDDAQLVSGCRIVAGTPLLPYLYQEEGNFMLLTENGDLPDWTQFGSTQTLVYLSIAEIEAVLAGN